MPASGRLDYSNSKRSSASFQGANRCARYFKSKFHCFDATIILVGFVIDVCLKGVLEEAGSIVVILRLWRVFKIVEEFSAGASDQMDILTDKLERLSEENEGLKRRIKILSPDGSNA